ncbi:hypothetical protein BN1221_03003c [Brenneria goodwinii]|uniref:Uncharacterized protein n=1 Tax=Brenneria goodwinii TaxID=1109412 RepID=A0A0G4JX92_9GAMM|nr:hypothetical protein BN1221_03003c [Brenneria goodwinii]
MQNGIYRRSHLLFLLNRQDVIHPASTTSIIAFSLRRNIFHLSSWD